MNVDFEDLNKRLQKAEIKNKLKDDEFDNLKL